MKTDRPVDDQPLFSAAKPEREEQEGPIVPRTEATMRRMRSPFTVDEGEPGQERKA